MKCTNFRFEAPINFYNENTDGITNQIKPATFWAFQKPPSIHFKSPISLYTLEVTTVLFLFPLIDFLIFELHINIIMFVGLCFWTICSMLYKSALNKGIFLLLLMFYDILLYEYSTIYISILVFMNIFFHFVYYE